MGEENLSTNSLGKEEHIYLDVIHIASRPQSKRSLCPTAASDESLQQPTVENVAATKMSKKSGNVANCVLVATIIFLSAVCCALCALYVIERRHSAMLESEKNRAKGVTASTPSTNCTRVSSGKRIIFRNEFRVIIESLETCDKTISGICRIGPVVYSLGS